MSQDYENEYWAGGLDLAIDSLGLKDRLMGANAVRDWIGVHVPSHGLLYTTVADFWLRIKKAVGQERRREADPPNPFVYRGDNNAYQGKREQIEAWHRAWIQRVGVEAQVKELDGKRDPVSRSLREALEQQHPWLVKNTARDKRRYTVGFAAGMTQGLMDRAFPDGESLDLEYRTLSDALRQPWFDHEERALWLKILRQVHRLALDEQEAAFAREEAELSRLALADLASNATPQSRTSEL